MTNICTWLWASHKRWDCLFVCLNYNLAVKIKVLQNRCTFYWGLFILNPTDSSPLPLKLVPPQRPWVTLKVLWWKEELPAGFPWKKTKNQAPDPGEDEDCRGWELIIPDFILTLPTNARRTTFWQGKKKKACMWGMIKSCGSSGWTVQEDPNQTICYSARLFSCLDKMASELCKCLSVNQD